MVQRCCSRAGGRGNFMIPDVQRGLPSYASPGHATGCLYSCSPKGFLDWSKESCILAIFSLLRRMRTSCRGFTDKLPILSAKHVRV